jgi:transcriptional regulator with XRE-family HTH domain
MRGIDREAAAFAASVRDQLHRGRERRNWTIEEVSERTTGVSPRLLERYERGEVDLDVFLIQRVCAALNLDVAAVLDEADRMAVATRGE